MKNDLDFIGQKLVARDGDWFHDNAINVKETDRYFILNYDQERAWGKWNQYNSLCRGTVYRLDGSLLSLPFVKFFDHGAGEAGVLDLESPITVVEKLDGTMLAVVYDEVAGEWIYHTRRMISSSDMDIEIVNFDGTKSYLLREFELYVREMIDGGRLSPEYIAIFEAITNKNRLITNYTDDEFGLHLIGGRCVRDLVELSESALDLLAVMGGFKRPRTFEIDVKSGEDLEHAIERTLGMDVSTAFPKRGFEGFVLRQGDLRMKLKQQGYFDLFGTACANSWKEVVKLWIKRDEVPLPEHLKEAVEKKFEYIDQRCEELGKEIFSGYTAYEGIESRKEFAAEVMKLDARIRPFVFSLRDRKILLSDLWSGAFLLKHHEDKPKKIIELLQLEEL